MVRKKGARFASLVAVSVLAFGALAACGGDDDGDSGSGSGESSGAASGGKVGVILPDTTTSPRWEAQDRPSLTQAFVPNFDGLEVWSHDLRNLAHPLRQEDFLTSNPALTPGGRVYVVGQTGDEGELFAFGPP